MDGALVILLAFLGALVLLDLAALRHGVDSRHTRSHLTGTPADDRPDWW
jgi:hypothetical protein